MASALWSSLREEKSPSQEAALWKAVLARAFRDATGGAWEDGYDEAVRSKLSRDAKAFLLDSREDFWYVCEMAGYTPSYVRETAKRILETSPESIMGLALNCGNMVIEANSAIGAPLLEATSSSVEGSPEPEVG